MRLHRPVLLLLVISCFACSAPGPSDATGVRAVAVAMAPGKASLAVGTTLQLHATLVTSDGAAQDVTATAQWTSSNEKVLTISDAGVATAIAPGSASVSASASSASGKVDLTVSSATLDWVRVSAPSEGLALGTREQLSATGAFSDGTTQDLTGQVAWSSSAESVARVDSSAQPGLVEALATGSVEITATLTALGKSGGLGLVVTRATLQSLEVDPVAPTLHLGNTAQLVAIGHFSDGTTQDLTRQVQWASDAPAVATVDSTGSASGIGTGTAQITASFDSVTAKATLAVDGAALVSIAISPTQATVIGADFQQFTAIGTYTDGSTQDITPEVTWSSDDATVATVSNATGTPGQAEGVAPGTANVSAAQGDVTSNTASLTAVAKALVGITITPDPAQVPSGTTLQLTATGSYNDGTGADLTDQVRWLSDDTANFTVSNASGSAGVVTWIDDGGATLYAVLDGVSGTDEVSSCPAGFYTVGDQCAHDYVIDVSGLVDQPDNCGSDAYYNDTDVQTDYGMQWQDAAPASFKASRITAWFSIGIACNANTQTYRLNGAPSGTLTVQKDCTCIETFEQQKSVDLSSAAASYVAGGSNAFTIDSPAVSGSISYGLMRDSAVGGQYGKVTVVY